MAESRGQVRYDLTVDLSGSTSAKPGLPPTDSPPTNSPPEEARPQTTTGTSREAELLEKISEILDKGLNNLAQDDTDQLDALRTEMWKDAGSQGYPPVASVPDDWKGWREPEGLSDATYGPEELGVDDVPALLGEERPSLDKDDAGGATGDVKEGYDILKHLLGEDSDSNIKAGESSSSGGKEDKSEKTTDSEKTKESLNLDAMMQLQYYQNFAQAATGASEGVSPGDAARLVGSALLPISPGLAAAVAGLGALADSTMGLAGNLAEYNAALFESQVNLDLKKMGFKYELADDTGESLASLNDAAGDLMEASEPIIAMIVNALAPALENVTRWITVAAPAIEHALNVFGEGINLLYKGINSLPFVQDMQEKTAQTMLDAGMFDTGDRENLIIGQMARDRLAEISPEQQAHVRTQAAGGEKKTLEGEEGLLRENIEEFGQFDLGVAFSEANKSLTDIHDETKGIRDDMGEKGNTLAKSLFTSLDKFGQSDLGKHGDQAPTHGELRLELPPSMADIATTSRDPRPTVPSTGTTTEQQIRESDTTPGGFPRPTPAAVDFKMTDQIIIEQADEDRFHDEFMSLRNEVVNAMNAVTSQRYYDFSMMTARMVGSIARG